MIKTDIDFVIINVITLSWHQGIVNSLSAVKQNKSSNQTLFLRNEHCSVLVCLQPEIT